MFEIYENIISYLYIYIYQMECLEFLEIEYLFFLQKSHFRDIRKKNIVENVWNIWSDIWLWWN